MIVNWLGNPAVLMYCLNRKTSGSRLEIRHASDVDLRTHREPTIDDIKEELKLFNRTEIVYDEYINLLENILDEYCGWGEW